jgi:hypothetical protein
MRKFIDTDARKFRQIQVRFDELSEIHSKYETAQNELECPGDTLCK